MSRANQIALLKRLLHYVDTGTTAMAEAPWRVPVADYVSPERLAQEQAQLFRRYPMFMGFASDWAQPGDYKTDDLAGVPILIVRGCDGVLRGFLNVCRHRGAKVVDGCGSAKAFSCAYHAWSYDLLGRVTHIPDERSFPGIKAERAALAALPLCEKHGLVWVMPQPAADGATTFDIDPWLGGIAEELAFHKFEEWNEFGVRVNREPMNWKILVDTFHEGYHIGFLHKKTLFNILHGNATDFESFGLNHRLTIPRQKLQRLHQQPEAEWDLAWNTTIIYLLFPSTIFSIQGDHVEWFRIYPDENRVDRAVMQTGLHIPKARNTPEEQPRWQKNLDLVLEVILTEDFPAGRTMQAGFSSGAQTHTVCGRNEPAMIHWHQALTRALEEPLAAAAE
jgi:phenylpropionate dioxygenase-like ring-hydroxylating dioxygenase large terminal subunit